jgi:hypothetical protein
LVAVTSFSGLLGAASYRQELGEFILRHDAVREATDPDATLLAFCESNDEVAATLGGWDRSHLEWT